jgi:hypothetical protein
VGGVVDKVLRYSAENVDKLPGATSLDFFRVAAFGNVGCSTSYDYYDLAEDKLVVNNRMTEFEVYDSMRRLKVDYAWPGEIPENPDAKKEEPASSLPEPVTTTL